MPVPSYSEEQVQPRDPSTDSGGKFLSRQFISLLTPAKLQKEKCFLETFYFILATPCGMRALSSPTRDRTLTPCSGNVAS